MALPKVVGGNDAPNGRYPYMASLQFNSFSFYYDFGLYYSFSYNEPVNANHFCGGALIAPDVVLTAAHCLDFFNNGFYFYDFNDAEDTFDVKLGCTDIRDFNCFTVGVSEFVINPLYDPINLGDDVGLIFLDRSVGFPTVALAGEGIVPSNGEPVIGLGWGATFDEDTAPGARLQEVDLSVVENDVCLNQLDNIFSFIDVINPYYNSVFNTDNLNTLICTIGDEKDVCFGDSGGPLVYGCDTPGVDDISIGIVSFGFNCAAEGAPGAFESVNSASTINFITQELIARGKDPQQVKFVESLNGFCPQQPIQVAIPPTPFPTYQLQDDWICPASFFGTLDGCDCECGAPDPDCATDEVIFGCDVRQRCEEGRCVGGINLVAIITGSVVGCVCCCCLCACCIFLCIYFMQSKREPQPQVTAVVKEDAKLPVAAVYPN